MTNLDVPPPSTASRITTNLLHVLPQHWLSAQMYRLARSENVWLKNKLIRFVIDNYKVNLDEAEHTDINYYRSFNAFFTRTLKRSARPLCKDGVASPVDGKVSQSGRITHNKLIQAKGHEFSLHSLLAGDIKNAADYENGDFATIYLSPRDYHRIHMPIDGTLRQMTFIPGELFSVSEDTTQLVPELFARNERLVCYFDTQAGNMALILVGAIFVGSMQTVWAGEVRSDNGKIQNWNYAEQNIQFKKGDEIARFNMGSTVIMLHPEHAIDWIDNLGGSVVKMGQKIGND